MLAVRDHPGASRQSILTWFATLLRTSRRADEGNQMRALVIDRPGEARVIEMERPAADPLEATMRIRRIGLCGTDLSTFLGKNPLVTYPRIPGHEVAATLERVPANDLGLAEGMNVTMSPYTSCGKCTACRQGRVNACRSNQTLGVQRDGALVDHLSMPLAKLYAAPLPIEELCLVEPLTVGCHAVARGRVTSADTVAIYGCGGVGLGAVSAAAFRGAQRHRDRYRRQETGHRAEFRRPAPDPLQPRRCPCQASGDH